jgi:hypothetical protein
MSDKNKVLMKKPSLGILQLLNYNCTITYKSIHKHMLIINI